MYRCFSYATWVAATIGHSDKVRDRWLEVELSPSLPSSPGSRREDRSGPDDTRNPRPPFNGAQTRAILTNFFAARGCASWAAKAFAALAPGRPTCAYVCADVCTVAFRSARSVRLDGGGSAVCSAADTTDAATTQAHPQANYALMRYFIAQHPGRKRRDTNVLAGVRRECPLAASGIARERRPEQLSNEVVGTMVTNVVQHNLPGYTERHPGPGRCTGATRARQVDSRLPGQSQDADHARGARNCVAT